MSSDDNWTEPLENPFTSKASQAAEPPQPPERRPSIPTAETDPHAVDITLEDAVNVPKAIASKSTKLGGRPSIAPPKVPEVAPPAEPEIPIDEDAPEWLRTASKRPSAEQIAAAKAATQRKGCFWACLRCCGRTHRGIVNSSVCTNVFLTLTTILLFSFFVVSLVFMRERVQAGNCAAPSVLCGLGFADKNCMSFGAVGQTCDSVCDYAAANNAAPFAFTVPGFAGGSGSFLESYVFCPFPKMNTNWRVPLTFFATLVGVVTMVALCKRWLKALFTTAGLLFFAGGVFFWVMVIDSAAIDKSSKACDSKFAAFAPGLKNSAISCVMQPYVAFALIDATLCVALLYLGVVLYHVFKRLSREAKEAALREAAKPASEKLTEEEKRQMFSKGDEEAANSSLPAAAGIPSASTDAITPPARPSFD